MLLVLKNDNYIHVYESVSAVALSIEGLDAGRSIRVAYDEKAQAYRIKWIIRNSQGRGLFSFLVGSGTYELVPEGAPDNRGLLKMLRHADGVSPAERISDVRSLQQRLTQATSEVEPRRDKTWGAFEVLNIYTMEAPLSKFGRLWLADSKVHYHSLEYGSWCFPVADLRAIGEYTTDSGPIMGDWFLAFVTSSASGWYEASVYAEGTEGLRKELAAALGTEGIPGQLSGSAKFASCIIWPPSLRGQQLLHFTPVRFSGGEVQMELSPEIRRCAGHQP